MRFDAETLQRQIPYYLTAPSERKAFLEELTALSSGARKGYFMPKDSYKNTILQGDGWSGFRVFSFEKGKCSNDEQGIVLSNSCDMSSENKRTISPKITFAPVVKLSRLRAQFERSGIEEKQIDSKLQAIRSQSVTNIFYLPKEGPLDDEHVVLLDDLHSMPVIAHQKKATKLFTLSMAAFYLFVFKLSIHFCRLHENINRTFPS